MPRPVWASAVNLTPTVLRSPDNLFYWNAVFHLGRTQSCEYSFQGRYRGLRLGTMAISTAVTRCRETRNLLLFIITSIQPLG